MADRRLAAEGRKVSLVEMVAEAKATGKLGEGVTAQTVKSRLQRGWTIVDATSLSLADGRARSAAVTRARVQEPGFQKRLQAAAQTPEAREKKAHRTPESRAKTSSAMRARHAAKRAAKAAEAEKAAPEEVLSRPPST